MFNLSSNLLLHYVFSSVSFLKSNNKYLPRNSFLIFFILISLLHRSIPTQHTRSFILGISTIIAVFPTYYCKICKEKNIGSTVDRGIMESHIERISFNGPQWGFYCLSTQVAIFIVKIQYTYNNKYQRFLRVCTQLCSQRPIVYRISSYIQQDMEKAIPVLVEGHHSKVC